MGGGTGPAKPDNPPATSQERVPIPAELHNCKSCREMRGKGNVANPLINGGFLLSKKVTVDNGTIVPSSFIREDVAEDE